MPLIYWLRRGAIALLLALTACDSTISSLPIFPTSIPTLVPSPTPTRADELVIPFQTLAVHDLFPLPADAPGGVPLINLQSVAPRIHNVEPLIGKEPTVFLVTRVEDLAPLDVWLPTDIITGLARVDYSQDIAIVYLLGVVSSAQDSYIQRVATSQTDGFTVYSVLYEHTYGTPGEAFPSQTIKISREAVPFQVTPDTTIVLNLSRQQVIP